MPYSYSLLTNHQHRPLSGNLIDSFLLACLVGLSALRSSISSPGARFNAGLLQRHCNSTPTTSIRSDRVRYILILIDCSLGDDSCPVHWELIRIPHF